MSASPVKFRGHHLLCMLTYQSQGYSPQFTMRFDNAVAAINAGMPILVCEGPDMLCETLQDNAGCHCHDAGVRQRDKLALEAVAQTLSLDIAAGSLLALNKAEILVLRSAFTSGRLRDACKGCEWQRLCTRVARRQYRDCLLFPPAEGQP